MTKTDHQRGDVVLYAGHHATVLRVYTLSWCTGAAARTIELVTVRTTGALASEFTVDASQVRSLSSQTVRYSRLGWTRTWKPGEDDDDDDYSDLRPEQVDALLTRMRSDAGSPKSPLRVYKTHREVRNEQTAS